MDSGISIRSNPGMDRDSVMSIAEAIKMIAGMDACMMTKQMALEAFRQSIYVKDVDLPSVHVSNCSVVSNVRERDNKQEEEEPEEEDESFDDFVDRLQTAKDQKYEDVKVTIHDPSMEAK